MTQRLLGLVLLLVACLGDRGYCQDLDHVYQPKYPLNAFVINTKRYVLPYGVHEGFVYKVTQGGEESVSLSWYTPVLKSGLLPSQRYSAANPLLFRVTLKGYSLFQSTSGDQQYFTFERAGERVIRKPVFLVSFTQRF